MKSITVTEAGPADSMKVVELPSSSPKAHEVVIGQTYAGVNYGDAIRRKRGLFKLNEHGYFMPGFEGVGKIISTGEAVVDFQTGDRVSYLSEGGGGYSQEICIDEKLIYKVPDNIPDKVAAVMTCVGATAGHLVSLSNIDKDSRVLIHGATGGVGLMLVQLCNLIGAKVIAVVGTEEKKEFLKRYGVTDAIIRSDGDISPQIKSVIGGESVDVIFDCVGQAVLDTNLNCIRKGGTILYYGSTSGHSTFPGMQILMNSLKLQGFNIFNAIHDAPNWKAELQKLLTLISDNKLEIYINEIFTMQEAHKAHELLEERNSIGKLLIDLS